MNVYAKYRDPVKKQLHFTNFATESKPIKL